VTPDPRYNSVQVAQFVNAMMIGGKKSVAQRILYGALDMISQRENTPNPLEIFERAVRNVTPAVEVKPRRVGGSTYQVPVEVPPDRARSLAIRWLLTAARSRSGKGMSEKLAGELMEAAKGQGNAMKKREETHRMAEANRAFSHYRW
jgi:small subunit ribosomal protein S7